MDLTRFAGPFISQGKEEGRAEGRAEGKAEGRAEGKAEMVLKLLTLRYGPLSEAVQARVMAVSSEQLDTYADRVLSAPCLSDVLREAPAKYQYQSDFAIHFLSQGRAEGRAEGKAEGRVEGKTEGKAEVVVKLLTLRYGPLSDVAQERVRAASMAQLDTYAERMFGTPSLDDVLRG